MFLRFANITFLYLFLPLLLAVLVYRFFLYKPPLFIYPLADQLADNGLVKRSYHKFILNTLRLATLIGLLVLILRPQWVDERSKINVDGRDIILAIDVSGSMQLFDDLNDQRPRIEAAKSEAIRFTERRIDDPIGIVLFARDAVSWCPLTLDKKILKEMLGTIQLGVIDPGGTWLGTGLATALNRLRTSKSKTKIVILLTDGQPTPPEKIDPSVSIDIAQKLGIKVYTIGIGGEHGAYINQPPFGIQQVQDPGVNVALLQTIAQKTGGQFFRANNPKEMHQIYEKIDALEKTTIQTSMFHRYYEAFVSFIWFVLLLFGLEFMARFFIWRGV
jgi:Ca-activated chloride channel family protein